MKDVIKIIAIVLAIGFIINSYSSCTLSRKLKEAEKSYRLARENHNNYVKMSQKQLEMLQRDRRKTINDLVDSVAEIDKLHDKNAELKKRWGEALAQKGVEGQLRARRDEIAQNLIQSMDEEIQALNLALNQQYEIIENLKLEVNIWKEMYEGENQLRLKCEKLYNSVKLYHKWKKFGFGFYAGVGVGIDGTVHPNVGVGVVWRF